PRVACVQSRGAHGPPPLRRRPPRRAPPPGLSQPRPPHPAVRPPRGMRPAAERAGLSPRQTPAPPRPRGQGPPLTTLACHAPRPRRDERRRPTPRRPIPRRVPAGGRLTQNGSTQPTEKSERETLSADRCRQRAQLRRSPDGRLGPP